MDAGNCEFWDEITIDFKWPHVLEFASSQVSKGIQVTRWRSLFSQDERGNASEFTHHLIPIFETVSCLSCVYSLMSARRPGHWRPWSLRKECRFYVTFVSLITEVGCSGSRFVCIRVLQWTTSAANYQDAHALPAPAHNGSDGYAADFCIYPVRTRINPMAGLHIIYFKMSGSATEGCEWWNSG